MPQTTLTENSPWMKALLSLSQGDGGGDGNGDFNMVTDAAQRSASATPAPTAPQHRIEDAKLTSNGGGAAAPAAPSQPQPSQPSAITGSINAGQTTQLADRIPKPPNALEQRVTENKAKLSSLGTDTAPKTLGDTVLPGGGFWRGLGRVAINAVGGGVGSTRRDEVFKNTLSQRTALQQSTEADTRQLSQEQESENRLREQEEFQRNLWTGPRTDIARANIAGRQGVADTRNAGAMDRQDSEDAAKLGRQDNATANKPTTKVMGNKTYQYYPDSDSWKEVGAAPVNITRAGNAPVGGFTQAVTNAAGDVVGWINPKLQGDAAFRPVSSIPSAAAAAGGNGALPMKPSGQTASRMQQGTAIQKAGDNLIADVKARANKMGNWGNFWKQMVSGSPLADPDQNYLANQIMSFAALQPAAHGARGLQAIQAFEKAIGGTPTDINAFIAGVQGIQRGLSALQPPTPQNPQTQQTQPPLANRMQPRDAKSFLALYPKGVQ